VPRLEPDVFRLVMDSTMLMAGVSLLRNPSVSVIRA
jgi:hypothetical protein